MICCLTRSWCGNTTPSNSDRGRYALDVDIDLKIDCRFLSGQDSMKQGREVGKLRTMFILADLRVRVFKLSGLVDTPSDRKSVWIICLSGYMGRWYRYPTILKPHQQPPLPRDYLDHTSQPLPQPPRNPSLTSSSNLPTFALTTVLHYAQRWISVSDDVVYV